MFCGKIYDVVWMLIRTTSGLEFIACWSLHVGSVRVCKSRI